MFRLATCEFRGRRVVLVESDCHTARAVSSSISASGGIIVGIAASVDGAVQIVSTIPVDVVFLHVRFASGGNPLAKRFEPFGATVAFRTGYDDWFDPDEDIDVHERVWVND